MTGADFFEPPELKVTVDRVLYQKHLGIQPQARHCFIYFISIHNGTDTGVRIKARKWVVTDANGDITAVEGEGVVGEFPYIPPGDSFEYNSFHLLQTESGVAEGSYIGVDDAGRNVLTRIPRMKLEAPERK